jgi:hypothetical protein
VAATSVPHSEPDQVGLFRIATGAGVGLAAALLAIVLPIGFLLVATYAGAGFLSLDQTAFLDATVLLVLAGALLFLVSFFLYRRGFAHLRTVDRRFTLASVLCLVGSVGFLLLLVAAVVVIGSSSSLLSCIHGHPSQSLSCLRSGQPLGAYTGLLGFWLGWFGGVGIVLGLSAASSRFRTREIGWGAALYGVLLLILLGPFVALWIAFPGAAYLLGLVPILSILAPFFVFRGSRPIAT